MAKRCGTRNGNCHKPRANWWKQALGVDWFNHNTGGGEPFDPLTDIPGLVFLMNGDSKQTSGSEVTQWTDQSTGAHHADGVTARNLPTVLAADINGKDVIDFNGTDNEILEIQPIVGITTYTAYILFKSDITSGNRSILSNIQDGAGTFLQQGFNILINANQFQFTNRSGVSQSRTFAFSDTTSYHVLTVKFQSNGASISNFVVKLDGLYKLDITDLNSIVPSTQVWYIGSNLGGTPNSFDGKIGEVIFCNQYHTEQTEAQVYGYLNDRYGLNLPTGSTDQEIFQNITYRSSIDSISNLFMRVCYDDLLDKPICVIMHGFSQSATDFTDATLRRFKDAGYFAIAVGMRSQNGASGTRDASARELHDIRDAISIIRSRFSVQANQTRVIMVGYSGGGGNVLGFISKFPDVLALAVEFFGISDYGYDSTFGWYAQSPANQANLQTAIGGTPAAVPNNYKSRWHMMSASNHKGRLRIYHDTGDSTVQVNHSQRVVTRLIADGFTNYVYNESTVGSPNRWLHGLPNSGVTPGQENIAAEATFLPEGLTEPIPVMPTSGTLKINGYLKCALFTIWLGNGTVAQDGTNRVATLVYDYTNNTYTLTPDIDAPDTDTTYSFSDDQGRDASGTIVGNTPTPFTPA